jgi:hypothetical protein
VGFQCDLHLPHRSHFIDPIAGPEKSSETEAKVAVALKACQ